MRNKKGKVFLKVCYQLTGHQLHFIYRDREGEGSLRKGDERNSLCDWWIAVEDELSDGKSKP